MKYVLSLLFIYSIIAQDSKAKLWHLETGLFFSHFQQQVKSEIGAARGERIINDIEIGLSIQSAYSVNNWLAFGLFSRLNSGDRNSANFAGFDADGKATISGALGGNFTEFWFGPFAKLTSGLFDFDLGYALIGSRIDKARTDLPSKSGNTEAAFSTDPLVAFMFAISANFPVSDDFDLNVKLEHRFRYYTSRNGENISNNIVHGTQSIHPLISMRYNW